MAYTIAPVGKFQFFDDNGDPLNGGLLYTYTAGTVTPATTYSNSTGTANANPIVLDSAGRCDIFLAATSYKFLLKTSAGATVWSEDNIQSTAVAASQATDNGICEGRLTLTSGTPVTTGDVTAATTVYFTPYGGNKIALYDGSAWNIRSFSELSLSLGTDTIDKNYDLWAYDNSSVPTLERLVWTNTTTRATALALQDGVLVKSGDATRRYLGTYRTTAAGQTEDSAAKRLVWNYAHRVRKPLRKVDATSSWTYTTAAYQQAHASTANQVAVVVGWAEALIHLEVMNMAENSGASAAVNMAVAIGEDSTTVPHASCLIGSSGNVAANTPSPVFAILDVMPAVGYHYYAWLEKSTASGTTTWDNTAGFNQGGIAGSCEA